MGNERLLNWVTVCAGILGLLGVLATLPSGNYVLAYSVAIGTAVAVLNLMALRRMGRRLIASLDPAQPPRGDRARTTGLFLLKIVLVLGGLWLLLKWVPIDALGLLGGLSAVVLAVILGTLFGPPAAQSDEAPRESAP